MAESELPPDDSEDEQQTQGEPSGGQLQKNQQRLLPENVQVDTEVHCQIL